jgi:hypothetical protein
MNQGKRLQEKRHKRRKNKVRNQVTLMRRVQNQLRKKHLKDNIGIINIVDIIPIVKKEEATEETKKLVRAM